MQFYHQFEANRIALPDFESRKCYDKRNLIPNFTAKFIYKRGLKHILLTQEKVDIDHFYQDYNYFHEQSKIVKSYVLDQGLAIVDEGNICRHFEKELELVQKEQESFKKQKNQDSYWNLPLLSFESQTFQIISSSLAPIIYRIFPSLNNFVIGRYNFVRSIQSHKITSDSISQQHCQITHFKSNSIKVQSYLQTIKTILTTLTPNSSKCRKIPNYIWQVIFDYVKPIQKYTLCDLGSRNGTWVYQIGTQICKLQQNFDYQFQKQSYSIHISKAFTSKDSQNESILKHNEKAHQILEQFRKQVNWNYYQRANKILIIQDVHNILSKNDEKIQILIFKLKYRDYHEYYLLAVKQSYQKKYSVGCKYDIDINPEQYDSPSLHGKIYVQNGKWMIESFEIKRTGEYRKIWTKLVKDYRYLLRTQKSYKIRLGSSFHLSLDFKNF